MNSIYSMKQEKLEVSPWNLLEFALTPVEAFPSIDILVLIGY